MINAKRLVLVGYLVFGLSGCSVAGFTASTEATFNKDGTWSYRSNKNQENFKAKITDAQGNSAEVETTATTPEAAIAAAAQSNASAMKSVSDTLNSVLQQLLPLVKGAAIAGS